MADKKPIQNKAEQSASQGVAPVGKNHAQYTVIKEYCGVEKGTIVESTDKSEIAHMLKNGYWKAK